MSCLKFCGKIMTINNNNLNKLLIKSNLKEIYTFNRGIYITNLLKENDGLKKNYNPGELKLINLLRNKFPNAKTIEVNDISGGCGSMYEVFVETNEFKNIRKVKQHQMVNQVLEAEIKNNMHGLRIYTAAAESIDKK